MNAAAFHDVVIPGELWADAGLTVVEKIALAEIGRLAAGGRACAASNRHFADFFGVSVCQASRVIGGLVRKGRVTVELLREGRMIVERRIHLARQRRRDGMRTDAATSSQKRCDPIGENAQAKRDSSSSVRSGPVETNKNLYGSGSRSDVAEAPAARPEPAQPGLPLGDQPARRPRPGIQDLQPEQFRDFAAREARGVDIRRELLKFRNWTAAKGRIHKDAAAAFRNWLMKAADTLKAAQQPLINSGPKFDPFFGMGPNKHRPGSAAGASW